MSHHEINKIKMRNDIVLTLALIISVCFVRLIMRLTNLDVSDYKAPIFFVLSFICIKITYHLFTKIAKNIDRAIKLSRIRR